MSKYWIDIFAAAIVGLAIYFILSTIAHARFCESQWQCDMYGKCGWVYICGGK